MRIEPDCRSDAPMESRVTSSTTCSEDAESKLSCSSFEVCTFASLSTCFLRPPLSCFEPTAGSTKKQSNQVLYSTEYTAETAVYSSHDHLFPHCKQMCTGAAAERFSKWGGGGVGGQHQKGTVWREKKRGHLQREISKRQYTTFRN